MVEHYPISARDQSRLHQCGKKVLPGIFLWYAFDLGVNFGKEILWVARHWRIGKDGRIGKFLSSKNQCKKYWYHKKEEFMFPSCRWHSKIVRRRPRIPRNSSKGKSNLLGEWRSQWRTSRQTRRCSTDRNKRWRWSRERFLVYSWWLHLSSSQWISKEESFPKPLRYIDVIRRTFSTLDMLRGKTTSGTLMAIETYRNLGPISRSSQYWMKTSWRMYVVLEVYTNSIQPQGLHVRSEGPACRKQLAQRKRKAAKVYRETEVQQCAKVERHLLYWSGW